MANGKVLYSVFVPPGRTRTLLDAIRFIAKPTAKHSAHVTVRGPYSEPIDVSAWSDLLRGQEVKVAEVGTFFVGNQNTVFLGVVSPAIRAAWDKPDYPDYNPHVTVYDGPSRPFAEGVRDAFASLAVRFHFTAGELEPMFLGQGSSPLKDSYQPELLTDTLPDPPSADVVAGADDRTRLEWISRLAAVLSS